MILPGSKSVRSDLAWLREAGWDRAIAKHLRYGGKLIGICGGFQMLGAYIDDPLGIEGEAGSSPGLGYFDLHTELKAQKRLTRVTGKLCRDKATVTGYEIHAGVSAGSALNEPFAIINESPEGATHEGAVHEGAVSADDAIIGTYLHGVFDHDKSRASLLHWAGLETDYPFNYGEYVDQQLERLADTLEQHLDIPEILANIGR